MFPTDQIECTDLACEANRLVRGKYQFLKSGVQEIQSFPNPSLIDWTFHNKSWSRNYVGWPYIHGPYKHDRLLSVHCTVQEMYDCLIRSNLIQFEFFQCEVTAHLKKLMNPWPWVVIHAVWFIRNTVKFGLVLFLKFSENYTRSVAYLFTFCFLILC